MSDKSLVDARTELAQLVQGFEEYLRAEEQWGVDAHAGSVPQTPQPAQRSDASRSGSRQAPTRAAGPAVSPQPPPVSHPARPVSPTPSPAAHAAPLPAVASKPSVIDAPAADLFSGVAAGATGLERVRAELGECTRCRLCEGRNSIVFGEGDPDADLMFIGEGPGAREDATGRPFVGRAGELLDKMIVAMGYARSQVYIANVVKCRPPNNRDPELDERLACRPFLVGQLHAIRPKVIVTLGRVATQIVLESDDLISRMRGRWHDHPHFPVRVMPTYHPAAVLRNRQLRRPVWQDLQQAMVALGQSATP